MRNAIIAILITIVMALSVRIAPVQKQPQEREVKSTFVVPTLYPVKVTFDRSIKTPSPVDLNR